MERRDASGFVWMGTGVRFLRDVREGWPVFGPGFVYTNLRDLLDTFDHYEMRVTERVAADLAKMKGGFDRELSEAVENSSEEDLEKTRRLTQEEADEINNTALVVQQTMMAEAEGIMSFVTREKRYNMSALLDDVSRIMPQGVYQNLPEIARYDFEQAGRCVAFEVPTAAAFHLMRGTEAVLRDFYSRIVKRDRVPTLMWGPMTDHMRKRRDTPPDVLMNNLDNLRRSFRNPTQHPEKVYDIDEAQDLMSLAVDVVSRMQRHLEDVGK